MELKNNNTNKTKIVHDTEFYEDVSEIIKLLSDDVAIELVNTLDLKDIDKVEYSVEITDTRTNKIYILNINLKPKGV